VFASHFSSWHQLTSSAMVLARNMFGGPQAFGDITQILKDFEKDRKMLRDMKTICDEKDQEMQEVLQAIQSKERLVKYSSSDDSNNNNEEVKEVQNYSETYNQIISALQKKEAEMEVLLKQEKKRKLKHKPLAKRLAAHHKTSRNHDIEKMASKNIEMEESTTKKKRKIVYVDAEKVDLKAKVSALESNLQDQLSTSTSQNMEILDLMDKLDKAYDQRDLCESKLINVNVRENSFSKQIQDLTKDKEELLDTVHQIDKAHTQNSDNILEAIKDSYEKIATINEEAELLFKEIDDRCEETLLRPEKTSPLKVERFPICQLPSSVELEVDMTLVEGQYVSVTEKDELIAKYANPAEDYPRHKDDISVLNKKVARKC